MGKCPKRPSPSPPAVVGTFPYNLLNGTAWASVLLCYEDSISAVTCLTSSRPLLSEGIESPTARKVDVSTSPQHSRCCIGPSIRNVDPPEDGECPRHYLE
jgi:hypothetical protein